MEAQAIKLAGVILCYTSFPQRGEITEYTKMMAEAREQAIQRMVEDAEKQGANAVIGMRFTTSMIMSNAAEVLAYGTGVMVK